MAPKPIQTLARIEQTIIDGEVVEVRLFPIPPETTVSLNEGDTFMTLYTKIDPFDIRLTTPKES